LQGNVASRPWYMHCSTKGPYSEYQLRLTKPIAIVNSQSMLFRALALTVAIVAMPSMASADARSESKSQVEFGIKVAQNGLWKEATYRWEKAVQLDPTYAEAWNNLAVGYEHDGRFDDADAAYQKAMKLDPKNLAIRTNYDLFKEIHDRTKRRRDR
jgi:Tfp pilus assembly protein PilF